MDKTHEWTQAQTEYLEWYVTPKANRDSQARFAEAHSVSEETLRRWRKTGWFSEAAEVRLKEMNVSPDRLQAVVDAMHERALQGDVRAATLYMQYVERLSPQKVVVEDKRVEQMSEAELRAVIEGGLGVLEP